MLGIWTLLTAVPVSLGLAHQAGAAIVFGLAVRHLHGAVRARMPATDNQDAPGRLRA
jgi:cytochrome c oxidase assembly protein subunit 15